MAVNKKKSNSCFHYRLLVPMHTLVLPCLCCLLFNHLWLSWDPILELKGMSFNQSKPLIITHNAFRTQTAKSVISWCHRNELLIANGDEITSSQLDIFPVYNCYRGFFFFNFQRVDLKMYNFRFVISLIKNLSWEAIGDYGFSLTHEMGTWLFCFCWPLLLSHTCNCQSSSNLNFWMDNRRSWSEHVSEQKYGIWWTSMKK